jgi:hypothetical protein
MRSEPSWSCHAPKGLTTEHCCTGDQVFNTWAFGRHLRSKPNTAGYVVLCNFGFSLHFPNDWWHPVSFPGLIFYPISSQRKDYYIKLILLMLVFDIV